MLGDRFAKIIQEQESSHLGSVVEEIAVRRRKAQKPLAASYRKAVRKGFEKRSRKLAEAVRWRKGQPEPTFTDAARAMLAPLVNEFFTAARADLSDIEALHDMRIAGKQLRYAMELLAGAFDESFRGELYPTFGEVQDKLGTINDHATAIAMFRVWFEQASYNGSRAELAELIADEERQLDAKSEEFRCWWTAERTAALMQHFADVLQVPSLSAVESEPVRNEPRKRISEAYDSPGLAHASDR